jgi:hypothetical protein
MSTLEVVLIVVITTTIAQSVSHDVIRYVLTKHVASNA